MNIKELDKRDKIALLVLGAFLLAFLAYQFIYQPLDHQYAQMQNELKYQQELYNWMKTARLSLSKDKKINLSSQSLLSETQSSLKRHRLDHFTHQLKQAENDRIEISFTSVPYSELITWMQGFFKKYSLNLEEAIIQSKKTIGLVKATIRFQSKAPK